MAVTFQAENFWVLTSCSVVVGYKRFSCSFHPEDGGNVDL
jgi:hypothetical protein